MSAETIEASCRRTRESAALFDLAFRVRLAFTGEDRVSFLHNLLSNDVASLGSGQGCYATILTQQSRVVADANVLRAEDVVFLDVDADLAGRAREHLEKYLVAEDVEIEDRSALETTLGVHGPASPTIVAEATGEAPPAAELGHRPATIGGATVRVVRVHWTGDPGFDLWVARTHAGAVRQALLEAGRPSGLAEAPREVFEVLRLEAGLPRVGIDVDESHLVLEAGLERGIHFRKGCYLGQEVVERQSARGHVNRKLVGVVLGGTVVPAADARVVSDGREAGRITRAVFSPTLGKPIALAWVRRELMEPGHELAIESGSDRLAGEVTGLPFYRPSPKE